MSISLKAKSRKTLTSVATKQWRKDGYIPSVVYGKEKETATISVPNMELLKTVRDEGRNAIITLDVEGGSKVDVMLHEYQTDPVKGDVIHADFYIVDMSEEMDVMVTLHLEGEPKGAKEGGILQQPMFELEVRAKPRDIPESITIDVTELDIGDSLSVADIPSSEVYEVLADGEEAIAVVSAPQAEEEEEESDVDLTAEPELVGSEDDDEDEEETE